MKIYHALSCFLFLVISFPIYAQKHDKRCAFDEYRASILAKNPNLQNVLNQTEASFRAAKSTGLDPNEIVVIPVAVNILHRGETVGQGRNITDEKVHEQIQILNDFFSNENGKGVDTNIRFCLARQDISGQSTTGINRFEVPFDSYTFENDALLKANRTGQFPQQIYLNIWVADIAGDNSQGSIYGYSSFPFPANDEFILDDPENIAIDNIIDGVVINYENFGKTTDNYAGEGLTSVHEVGHWLGLYHTFHNPYDSNTGSQCEEPEFLCDELGDKVCDTEPVIGDASSYVEEYEEGNDDTCKGTDCNNSPTTAVQNFMDYINDKCYSFFTAGQVERMREQIWLYRWSMTANNIAITECTSTIDLDPGNSGCDFPEIIEDDWGYRISGVGNSVASLNNGTLAVLGPYSNSVFFYEVNECSIEESERLYFANQMFIENIHLKDNFLFVQKSDDNYVSSVLVYVKNSSNIWEYKQELLGLYGFGSEIVFKENILLIRENNKILAYNYSGATFSGRYELDHFDTEANRPIASFEYNGQFLALLKTNGALELHSLNSSNNFDRVFPFNSSDEATYHGRFLTMTSENDNKLFLGTGWGSLTEMNLNALLPSGAPLHVATHTPNFNGYGQIVVQDDLIIVHDGMIRFYDRLSNDLHQVQLPNDFPLDNQYSTTLTSGLFPVPRRSDRFPINTNNRSATYKPQIDDNIMLVKGRCSWDIYLYNIESLLNRNISDRQICQEDLGASYIRGKNITVGGSACQPTINDKVEVVATESITLKSGTTINEGSNFSAKIRAKTNCKLTGGLSLGQAGQSSNNASRVNNQKSYDELLEDFGIKISPNPTTDKIIVTTPQDKIVQSCQVFNLGNASLFSYSNEKSKNEFELDFSAYPAGMYIIKFAIQDGTTISKKIIKE